MSIVKSLNEEDIQVIEQEMQKIKVLSAEGVKIEKISAANFKEICLQMKRSNNNTLIHALFFPKDNKIITF